MEILLRQENTLDGLRSRLYDTLDKVIDGSIEAPQVECICAVSEQIVKSAQLEVDTLLRLEESRREERREVNRISIKMKETIDAITIPQTSLEAKV